MPRPSDKKRATQNPPVSLKASPVPDGQVLWMSNAGNPSHGTDWWTMNPDGSNPQRLSDFNAEAIGHKPVYATVVQTANWFPDNSYFYGDVETNLLNSDSVIARVALTCRGS
jgi:hypothetical protein